MSDATEEPRSPKRKLAQKFIAISGVKPTDKVIITGTGNLELLIEFIRRGFSHVACQSDNLPHITTQPADVLIVPSMKSDADFHNVLLSLARDIRPQGLLVISFTLKLPFMIESALRRLLKEGGFSTMKPVNCDQDFGTILCARKKVVSVARAA